MKAITIWQPWAWAIAEGYKDIENRTWSPPRAVIGQRIAIHAGLRFDDEAWTNLSDPTMSPIPKEAIDEELGIFRVPMRVAIDLGAIIAVATLGGALALGEGRSKISPWYSGPVGWVLSDVVKLEAPISCRGAQGLWTVPDEIQSRIVMQLAA